MPCYRFVLLSLLLITSATFAQQPEGKTLSITPDERDAAVLAIGKEFDARYVFPEVASKVKEALEAKIKEKSYDSITTGQALADVLTTDIQAICKDKHVRVNCSTEKLPKNSGRPLPSSADMKKMQEGMKARNAGFTKVERLPGNIGYFRLDGFMNPSVGKDPLLATMLFLQNTDALIIDLRYNGGGTPDMIRDLCSYFFDETPVHLNSMYFRQGNRKEEFWTNKEVPGPRYLNKDVYLLTSAFTFSGAEECAYNFQTQKRGTIVGEMTGGGAHPGGMVPVADHYSIFIPTGRAINPVTGTNWEGVGVKPDVAVNADKAMETAQELAIKKLLNSKDDAVKNRVQQDVEQSKRMEQRIEQRRQAALKEREGK
jgi:retinol-binding protein 3